MKTVRALLFVGSMAAVGGCGENKAVIAAKQLADAVCSCSDLACAQKATADGDAKLMEVAATARGTEEDAKKILAESERATNCLQRLAKR